MTRLRVPTPSRVRALYEAHFRDQRRERLFLSGVSFFTTFSATRAITLAQRRGIGPFRSVGSGGTKVHHYVFGIGLLLTTGYSWLFLGGAQTEERRRLARATTVVYGIASALTIDEFNIWLHVKDDYWKSPFRELIDAAILTTSAASIGAWGWPFFRALAREMRS